MKYYSTNGKAAVADFREATINGQPSDKGLYFPDSIPAVSPQWLNDIRSKSQEEIAFDVIRPYIGGTIPDAELFSIVSETVSFKFPLAKVDDHVFALELFHGPTLAFKDVGARFMSRCLGHFAKGIERKITVLVATSGDTGGAVADGFFNVEGVEVVILYPSGKVSAVQEKQLTTYGRNIRAIEINGTFDDCQKLVKTAFADAELNKNLFLTSANSINVARWLPQQFYYFFAYQQWTADSTLPVISVPSGNFGNLCAGLLAFRSGLPVRHFIAACNANNVVPRYLDTGKYAPAKAVATLSNAMDVGDPSNFIRMLEIFDHKFGDVKTHVSGISISDEETKAAIRSVYSRSGYLLDPHGAVAYEALDRYMKSNHETNGILLETAHPVKFFDAVEPLIDQSVSLPERVTRIMNLPKHAVKLDPSDDLLKEFLLNSVPVQL
jgi:threonine synthase